MQTHQVKIEVFVNVDEEGYPHVIDQVEEVTGKGRYSGQTEGEIRARYPLIKRSNLDAVVEEQESLLRTVPEVISQESWTSALEALPPCNWVQTGSLESFVFGERYSGRITTLYARIGTTYWKFRDICSLSHTAIIERVLQEMQRTVPA